MIGLYQGYLVARWSAEHLPWPAVSWTAQRLADLACLASPRDRAAVARNYAVLLKDSDPRRLRRSVGEMYREFASYLAQFLRARRLVKAQVERQTEWVGREHLDRLVAARRGAILLTAHLGHWEMEGLILALCGYPLVGLALTHPDPRINRFFNEQRQATGARVLQAESDLPKIPRLVREGAFIGLLGDRDFFGHGARLPLFGRPVSIPKGPATYSLRLRVPVVPTFCLRVGPARYRLVAEPPIEPPQKFRSIQEAIVQLTKRYVTVLERYIAAYPTQWLVFQPIFDEHPG